MKHDDDATRLIIDKVIAGDTNAFKELLGNYSTFAYNIAFRVVRNKADAEEIVQDSFLRVFRYLKKFKGDSKFSTWLYKIVYRTSLTKIQKKRESVEYELMSDAGDEYKMYSHFSEVDDEWKKIRDEERQRYIQLALHKLSAQDNVILTLYYINENSVREVCEIMNCSDSACKVKLLRARKRLLAELRTLLKSELKDLM